MRRYTNFFPLSKSDKNLDSNKKHTIKKKRKISSRDVQEKSKKSHHEIDDKIKNLANDLDEFYLNIQHPLTGALIVELKKLQSQKKLVLFMQYTDNKVFAWALKHRNFDLIDYFQTLPEKSFFIILSYNDYSAIQQFLQTHVEEARNETKDIIGILEKILLKLPEKWEMHEVITRCVDTQVTKILQEKGVLKAIEESQHDMQQNMNL